MLSESKYINLRTWHHTTIWKAQTGFALQK